MKIRNKKLAGLGLALASVLTLSGCYDDGYYGGVSVGYGTGGYYDDYYPYGYYGYPVYGWYDGFYYPGRGYWVYDRVGKRHRWSDRHRDYWEGRREAWRRKHGDHDRHVDRNWRGNERWEGWRNRQPDVSPGGAAVRERWQGWRERRSDMNSGARGNPWRGGRSDAPSRGSDGGRWGRGGEGGAAMQHPAPGPMGHVFRGRGRRD